MKALLINGSPRKEGNTYVALNEAAQQLQRNGIDTEILWLGTQAVHGCISCQKCRQGDTPGHCVFNDDPCNQIIDSMKQADAIIIGAPVYWGQPAAQAMAIQQRMLYAAADNFKGKPAAVVCVCRRGGATAAFQTLQMPFQMCSMPIVTSQYWNIAYGREPGQASLDSEGMQTMRTLANNMTVMLQKYATGTAIQPQAEEWQPTHFIR